MLYKMGYSVHLRLNDIRVQFDRIFSASTRNAKVLCPSPSSCTLLILLYSEVPELDRYDA